MANENEKRELVTRGEFNRYRTTAGWAFIIIFVMIFLVALLSVCRADSTFAAIKKANPRVDTLRWSCPICGKCQPYEAWRDNGVMGDIILPIERPWGIIHPPRPHRVTSTFACSTCADTAQDEYPCIFDTANMSNQVIIWGRWRTICRVDCWYSALRISPPGGYIWSQFTCDTIYTDDPRCGRLDSVYTLPHDTAVNCRMERGPCPSPPTDPSRGCLVIHWRDVCDTIQIPGHWTYFNWSNGKRVNMRRVK